VLEKEAGANSGLFLMGFSSCLAEAPPPLLLEGPPLPPVFFLNVFFLGWTTATY
jgi:hypothetical protein